MSGIIRRRNFFLDEDEIVKETERLTKERELQEQRIRDQAFEESERYRETLRKKTELDALVNKGFNWLTSLSDDQASESIKAPDIFEEDDFYLDDWFSQFIAVEETLQAQLADQNLTEVSKENFRDYFDEINKYGIIKQAFICDKFFDHMIGLTTFKIIVDNLIENLKGSQLLDQNTLDLDYKVDKGFLAVYINDDNIVLKKKFELNSNFIYYKEIFKKEDLQHVSSWNQYDMDYHSWDTKRNKIISSVNVKNKIIYFDNDLFFERLVHKLPRNNVCVIRDPPLFENKKGELVTFKHERINNNRFYGFRRIDDSFNIIAKIAGDFRDRKLLDIKNFKKKKFDNEIKITKFLNG